MCVRDAGSAAEAQRCLWLRRNVVAEVRSTVVPEAETRRATPPRHATLPSIASRPANEENDTHMTMSTVDTTTLWTPPPRTGSAMTGSVSLVIMFASRSVTSSRWPFCASAVSLHKRWLAERAAPRHRTLRMGSICAAYLRCWLRGDVSARCRYHWRTRDARCAGDAQDVQLRLVERHVAEREAGEEAGEQDEERDEDAARDELRAAGRRVGALGERGRGRVEQARGAGEVGDMVGERGEEELEGGRGARRQPGQMGHMLAIAEDWCVWY
jgi:hypothetical protein